MNNTNKMNKIYETLKLSHAYNHAMTLLSWDLETEAPEKAVEGISETMEILSLKNYEIITDPSFKELVYTINTKELSELDKQVIEKIKEEIFEKIEKIPADVYSAYSALLTKSEHIWAEAKTSNDLDKFKDTLISVINSTKKIIGYKGYKKHPYDVLLDDYEPGLTVDSADELFNKIKEELVPFIKEITNKKDGKIKELKNKFNSIKVPIYLQKKISLRLMEIMNFDFTKGLLKESEHPFTTNMNNKDVRLTTHYYENDLLSSIYSTIHETGHAIYEQQIADKYSKTNILGVGASMGMHEAQSRLFENNLGKDDEYVKFMYDEIINIVPEIGEKISLSDFTLIVNDVLPSFVRTDADEVTYPLHILIRYELEKEIFSNLDEYTDIQTLSDKWNDKYEEYLGIRPKTYSEGILQDVHWAAGLFGYFPSYLLGSAYASQFYNEMFNRFDLKNDLKNKDFKNINNYLKDTIHQYGASKKPSELIEISTGESFDPNYYINYLKNKYSKIFEL